MESRENLQRSTVVSSKGFWFCLLFSLALVPVKASERVSLKVYNTSPFEINSVIAVKTGYSEYQVHGWYDVAAGSSRTLTFSTSENTPEIYVYAQTKGGSSDMVSWALGSENQKQLYWEGFGLTVGIANRIMDDTISQFNPNIHNSEFRVGFMKADPSRNKGFFQIILNDQRFSGFDYQAFENNHERLAKALNRAKLLNRSFARRIKFDKHWNGRVLPFDLGLEFKDTNGYDVLGLKVSYAHPYLPDGRSNPIRSGDVLIKVCNSPIFGIRDVAYELIEHGTCVCAGIKKPMHFTIIRDGKTLTGSTTYWFNSDFYRSLANNKFLATYLGFTNGLFLGQGAEVRAIGTNLMIMLRNLLESVKSFLSDDYDPEYFALKKHRLLVWQNLQQEAMTRQFNAEDYEAGSFVSLFVGSSSSIIRAVGGRSARRFASSTAGRIALESMENIIWTASDGSPLRTTQELEQELRQVIPLSFAGSVFQNALSRRF